ncbi:substrate-binding domain-containing protein [Paenibacillus rhizovicinus]|uniref:Substrate-binding domain-containing protein n=1 Tax=Paenibacillus rhizovicinus TaxID=2704463 RepID=A0A6C0P184_9BACL|nr:substrate-binding domain-containing protein [Paenibacillus rhizovicinus]QHW32207.1 substrate-binding domain-containing protein [Paenibacillus rhizovicinus]
MKRVKLLAIMMLLIALPLATSCARTKELQSSSSADRRSVALIVKDRSGEFWTTVRLGAEAAAKEFNIDLKFDGTDSDSDWEAQAALTERYVAYGANAVVLAAADYEKLAGTVEAVERRGVQVVAIESEIHSSKTRSFIGIDNYEAGRQAARKMIELAGNQAGLHVIGDVRGNRNAMQRVKGITDEAAAAGMKITDTVYCASTTNACKADIQKLLKRVTNEGQAEGILALNAATSSEAARQLDQMGLAGRVKLVGFDNAEEELEWLQEGVIQATVIQNPFSMGYLGVKTAVQAMDHQQVNRRIDTGTKVIDAENMFWSDNQKMLFPFVQ